MKFNEICLKSKDLVSLEENLQKEWLLTNGIGGYASSTVLGINTRKYHGLLISALNPPGYRTVHLEKIDEDITINNQTYRFGANEFKDIIYPKGFRSLKEFSINPFPTFIYSNSVVEIKKNIFMPTKKNAVILIYNIINKSSKTAKIKLFPLVNSRNFHKISNNNLKPLQYTQIQNENSVVLSFCNPKSTLAIFSTKGKFIKNTNFIQNIYYRQEDLRGESSIDDCLQPGFFELKINPKKSIQNCIIASSDKNMKNSIDHIQEIGITNKEIKLVLKYEAKKNRQLLIDFYFNYYKIQESNWLNWILLAAKNLVVGDHKNKKHIIAGYFWFGPWGRDTFISLPGLLLVPRRFNAAKNILYNFSKLVKNGLVPNFQQDQQKDVGYNTVDASLWYLNAILQYLKYTGDFAFVQKKLWSTILKIVRCFEKGTDFGIKMDQDCLLQHGPQLTWMDAIVDGKAVNPRSGKAVEIQSLWYNALKIIGLLAEKFGDKYISEKYAEIASKSKLSFNRKFWNKKRNCLFDVVGNDNNDSSIRPNQIIPVALDFSIIENDHCSAIIDVVSSELLTPYGLRTLEKKDSKYNGKYVGNRQSRDQAYHNGTVWPWLLGPFITAYFKIKKIDAQKSNTIEKNILQTLLKDHLLNSGLGYVSEVFDGDLPHKARGCIAQAWSIAEPLRAYIEDIMNIKPKFNEIL